MSASSGLLEEMMTFRDFVALSAGIVSVDAILTRSFFNTLLGKLAVAGLSVDQSNSVLISA